MGIEKNKTGAYLPDKETKWPEMNQEERSKVYGSLKETYGGSMAKLDLKQELEKKKIRNEVESKLGMNLDDFWGHVNSFSFEKEFKANDPKLKGQPVSMALLLSFKEQFDKDDKGMKGKEKQMMFFSLNYLQNAPENKAKNPKGNIDLVRADGKVVVTKSPENRWILQIKDSKDKIQFDGYLFPDEIKALPITEADIQTPVATVEETVEEPASLNIFDYITPKVEMTEEEFWSSWGFKDINNSFDVNSLNKGENPMHEALMKTFQEKIPSGNSEDMGILGHEADLAEFSVQYLQNADENINKNPDWNTSNIPKDGKISIAPDELGERWVLKILDKDENILFEGFIFPDK